MMLNFYHTTTTLFVLSLITYALSTPMTASSGYTNLPDIFTSVLLNDAYQNSYYFFWTNFWYLPTYVTALVVAYSMASNAHLVKHAVLFATTTYLLVVFELQDYTATVLTLHPSMNPSEYFNTLLLNSINKYHPFVLYLVASIVLHVYMLNTCHANTYQLRYSSPLVMLSSNAPMYHASVLLFATLFLGGWWALQEGSWGGWWNWDPSEVFGLLMGTLLIRMMHSTYGLWSLRNVVQLSNYYTTLMLVVYFFMQLNFDLVSHNFGTKSNQFVDSVYFFMAMIASVLLVCAVTTTKYLSGGNHALLLNCSTCLKLPRPTSGHFYSLAAVFVLMFYMSFNLLVNDFFWSFFQLNVANAVHQYTRAMAYLYVILYMYVYSASPHLLPSLLLLVYQPMGYAVAFYATSLTHSRTAYVHYLFLVFTSLCILNTGCLESYWSLTSLSTSLALQGVTSDAGSWFVALNDPLCEVSSTQLLENHMVEPLWNFFWVDTSPESRMFSHSLGCDWSDQALLLGNLFFTFSMSSADPSNTSLLALTLMLIALMYSPHTRKTPIVF